MRWCVLMFVKLSMFCLFLQRNHSLFGSVMSALTGSVKTGLPFSTRTQSLFINHSNAPPIMSPTNSFHGPHTKPSPRNSINGRLSPTESTNHIAATDHLTVDLNNAINSTPSPEVSNRMSKSPSPEAVVIPTRRSSKSARLNRL